MSDSPRLVLYNRVDHHYPSRFDPWQPNTRQKRPNVAWGAVENLEKGWTLVVNDDSWTTDTEVLIKEFRELRHEIAALRSEVSDLRDEVRHNRTERDQRIQTIKERIEDIEDGCLDVAKVVRMAGQPTSSPGIRDIYRDVDRAAKRATRKGREQRVDIPDGDHPIVAHIQPGTDATTVIRNVCSVS